MDEMTTETEEVWEDGYEPDIRRCLSFKTDENTLFIGAEYVIEIINDQQITALPMLPDYVKGILNLRGQILPVIDVRLYMGKEAIPYTSKTCIIVLNIEGILLGIIVDSVCQVMDIDFGRVSPIPARRKATLLNGMLNMPDGEVLMAFDCKALLRSQNLIN